jgi:hypothetical protein
MQLLRIDYQFDVMDRISIPFHDCPPQREESKTHFSLSNNNDFLDNNTYIDHHDVAVLPELISTTSSNIVNMRLHTT